MSIFLKTNKASSIRNFLNSHRIVRIRFRKKDGDERTMIATNDPRLMPADAVPFGGGTTHDYHTSYPVFDLHKQEWRSFKPDNLIDIEALDGYTVGIDGSVTNN